MSKYISIATLARGAWSPQDKQECLEAHHKQFLAEHQGSSQFLRRWLGLAKGCSPPPELLPDLILVAIEENVGRDLIYIPEIDGDEEEFMEDQYFRSRDDGHGPGGY